MADAGAVLAIKLTIGAVNWPAQLELAIVSIGRTTCEALTTPGSGSSSKWTRLSRDLGRTTLPTPSVTRTLSGRRRNVWPSWSGSDVAKNKAESEPARAGAAENGLCPSEREDIVSTRWVPEEIRLDDERTLVLTRR